MKKFFLVSCLAVACVFTATGCGKKVEEPVVVETTEEEQPQAAGFRTDTVAVGDETVEILNDSDYTYDEIQNSIPTDNVQIYVDYIDFSIMTQRVGSKHRGYIHNGITGAVYDRYDVDDDTFVIFGEGEETHYCYVTHSEIESSDALTPIDNVKNCKSIHYVSAETIDGAEYDVLELTMTMKTQEDYMTSDAEKPENFEAADSYDVIYKFYINKETKTCLKIDVIDDIETCTMSITEISSINVPDDFADKDSLEVITEEQSYIMQYSVCVAGYDDGGIR